MDFPQKYGNEFDIVYILLEISWNEIFKKATENK